MNRLAWFALGLMAAGPAVAATPKPPADVIQATWQFYRDALPQAGPGEDPADYPPPLPATPDAKTVRGWLKTGVLRPIKVTPSPGADWLVDSNRMAIGNYYCGTGGCTIQIWTQAAGGSTKIFDQQVREFSFHWIGKKTGHTWMETDFHGSYCGKTGNEACPWGFEWRDDGRGHSGFWGSWRFAKGTVIHPGAPPQAVDPIDNATASGMPQVIVDTIAKNQAACVAWGADSFSKAGVANALPDLNGDGIDDWSYNGAYGACNFDEPDPDAEDVSDKPSEHEHANDDPCTILSCETVIWLSRCQGSDIAWERAPLNPQAYFALRYKAGRTELLELDNAPGVKDDEPGACDTYTIDNCVMTPVSLPSNP